LTFPLALGAREATGLDNPSYRSKATVTASQASYKDTLNLLQTPFAMRANARQREPELQALWAQKNAEGQNLYERLSRGNAGEVFTLHDGPPYANGALHVGHALNKILKDIINKHALLKGQRAQFRPGWDCHGLPIELKVLQAMADEERRALTPLELRRRARDWALEQVEQQKRGFQRWGIWAEWEQPYLTLDPAYEAAQIGVFGRMAKAGHIYRGLKPVHWSPSSRTALAEAELEYPDGHISQSVYVAFPVVSLPGALVAPLRMAGIEGLTDAGHREQVFVAIWTTTPWTLPANLAVSVNGDLEYAFCRDRGAAPEAPRYLLVALGLVESLRQTAGLDLEPLVTLKGSELAGIEYRHPLLDRTSPVLVAGDYITIESGTGLVHTAPGHGVDDFNTGRQHGLPVLCPVDEAGILTAEAGPFAGLNVLKDANGAIITALREAGVLLAEQRYEHRYPYDWRTGKPTIFRATEQWFASVAAFREQALAAIEQVSWMPASGRNRIEAMVRDRGDWCISRQRTWGVPIPVFYHRETGEVLLNEASLTHIQALVAEHGSDVWWERSEVELLPPGRAAEADQWRKGTDTMDVWFDSGSSWAGVLGGLVPGGTVASTGLNYPADLYLEGSDQHRGWFQSSLLTSVAVNAKAPFKTVLTHGFTLDEKGRKMSKSLGNVVDPAVLVEGGKNEKQEPAYGADVLRLWVSSVDYSADVPLGPGIVKQLADVYRKVRNTARYLLGNLHDFDPTTDAIPIAELPLLDRWMLQRTAKLIDAVSADFERYEFYRFFQALQNFCVVDLSNVYLDIAKDRLYVSGAASFRRRSCQTVLHLVVERLAGLIAPVLCHMAEDIWQNLPYPVAEASVFERGWPAVPQEWRNPTLEPPLEQILALRTLVNRQLETCRQPQGGSGEPQGSAEAIGSSLEAQVYLEWAPGEANQDLRQALALLETSPHPEVDNLADWLLVSALQIGGESPIQHLAEATEDGLTVRIARANGQKCERCWHYETDIGQFSAHPSLCGRCVAVLAV
jgi:isoleucyl-tRNA synthetase